MSKCHWCDTELVKRNHEGKGRPPDDTQTKDHIWPTIGSFARITAAGATVPACYACNRERNVLFTKANAKFAAFVRGRKALQTLKAPVSEG